MHLEVVTNRLHLLLPQRMKWLPKTFNTPPRAKHTVMCVTIQRHRVKVPLTHHHESIMVLKRTMYLGDLKVLRVFRIATTLLCQNLRGSQLVLLRRYILGTSDSTTVPEDAFLSLYSPEAMWCVSQKDCFVVSHQRDLIWL